MHWPKSLNHSKELANHDTFGFDVYYSFDGYDTSAFIYHSGGRKRKNLFNFIFITQTLLMFPSRVLKLGATDKKCYSMVAQVRPVGLFGRVKA